MIKKLFQSFLLSLVFLYPFQTTQLTLQQRLDAGENPLRVPAGVTTLTAPLLIKNSFQTIDFTGSTLVCQFDDNCIISGDPSNYNGVSNVTLINPKGAPTTPNGTHSFIAVYSQKTRVVNVMTAPTPQGQPWGTWGHLVTVLGDQAFMLDGLDTTSGGFNVTCNATFCGSWIYAPGPFHGCLPWCPSNSAGDNAAVGWFTHMQLSGQCQGNGIDWQSGNTLKVTDSVVQSFAQFNIRSGVRRGGYGGTELDNVYQDQGCQGYNPSGNIGQAGIIMQGGYLTIHSDRAGVGLIPQFASTGSNPYVYWIVANDSSNHDSVPLYLTTVGTDKVTPVNIMFPRIPGTVLYKILRFNVGDWEIGSRQTPPVRKYSFNALVGTVADSTCTSTTCSFTDTQAPPTTYIPTAFTVADWWAPDLPFWPGNIILSDGATILAADNLIGAYVVDTIRSDNSAQLHWVEILNYHRNDKNGTELYCGDCGVVDPVNCKSSATPQQCACWNGNPNPGFSGGGNQPGAMARKIQGQWLCN